MEGLSKVVSVNRDTGRTIKRKITEYISFLPHHIQVNSLHDDGNSNTGTRMIAHVGSGDVNWPEISEV